MNILQKFLSPIQSRFASFFHGAIFRRKPYDFAALAYLKAANESADFFSENLRLAQDCKTKSALLEFALKQIEKPGLWLEFGVYKGRDITVMAGSTDQTVYGFDSFEGLPEDWTFFQRKGRFSLDGKLPLVPPNVKLIKGWFDETLPGFLAEHSERIAFLHVDSDLYSSAKYVLETVNERIHPGTVILFDDFLNYPGWKEGEAKAFQEWLVTCNRAVEFIGFAATQQAVCVRVFV